MKVHCSSFGSSAQSVWELLFRMFPLVSFSPSCTFCHSLSFYHPQDKHKGLRNGAFTHMQQIKADKHQCAGFVLSFHESSPFFSAFASRLASNHAHSVCEFAASVDICMSRLWLSTALPNKWSTSVYPHTLRHTRVHLVGAQVERGLRKPEVLGFSAQRHRVLACYGSAGRIIGSHQFFQLTDTQLVTMWSTWLYSVGSVIVSVGAIVIIAIIHRRTNKPQVLSPMQPLLL